VTILNDYERQTNKKRAIVRRENFT
jgi:hypothetical protein